MRKERLVKKRTNKHFFYENIRNSSKKKSMNGITLIALVITIVLNCCKAAMDRVNDKEIDILKI